MPTRFKIPPTHKAPIDKLEFIGKAHDEVEFFLRDKGKCFIFWTDSVLFFPCLSWYQLGNMDLYFKTNFLPVLYIWEHLKVTSSESQNKHPLSSALSVCLFLKEWM
jgi:hypothetical protein